MSKNNSNSSSENLKEITKYLDSTKSEKPTILSEKEIKMGIMKFKKCNLVEAKEIFEVMKMDGLELFLTFSLLNHISDNQRSYNITEYGILREYLS